MASGHGVMSLLAAETRLDIHANGLDISPLAVAIANPLLGISGHGSGVTFEVKDNLNLNRTESRGTCQGIIAAMLAEHLEAPHPLCKVLAPEKLIAIRFGKLIPTSYACLVPG
jgi:hypothetical protein